MNIKVGKFEANAPAWAFLLAALVADNMYANHCNTKRAQLRLEAMGNDPEEEEDEES